MLKLPIKYTDYDGVERESTHYFNLSKPELIELEVEFDAGFGGMIEKIIETEDRKGLIALFKRIVLMSIGEQVQDGNTLRFRKSEEIREKFSETMAYNTLFMDLATDDVKAADFMQAVLPADLAEETPDKPKGPPVPPS